MIVKICGITNREDAIAAVNAGASALGFNFYRQSPRYIESPRAAELGAGIAALKVGIFVNEPAEAVAASMRDAAIDVAQVYGDLPYPGLRTWRAYRVNGQVRLSSGDTSEAFLLDGFSPDVYGGAGISFDWALAKGLAPRIIVAGRLDASNVSAAIETARPWGVDACSRIEMSPGQKDHDKMKRFIDAALQAAARYSL